MKVSISARVAMMYVIRCLIFVGITTGSNVQQHEHNPPATTTSLDVDPDDQVVKLYEDQRLNEYANRNYTWPIVNYIPNTPGWKSLMEERFGQISELDSSQDRYEAHLQMAHSALLVPNFTEYGFGLGRCPDSLLQALQDGIHDGLSTAGYETKPEVIDAPQQPLFINRPDLTERVLYDLRGYAEEWAGVPLTPYRAYGFRLYQNESQLYMHVDKPQTHIISFILHIASSDDSDPWPIVIEDFYGNTHEVILKPGDMLFYESSKCYHGRPRKFNGSWYSSVFVHYYPTHGWQTINHKLEAHYAVPPIWKEPAPVEKQYNRLVMKGTSMKEPDCAPDDWCRMKNAIKWSGPGEKGYIIQPNGDKLPFHPRIHDEL